MIKRAKCRWLAMLIRSKIARVLSRFKKDHRQRIGDHNSMDGFGFVMNVSSLDAPSYELAPKCVLRRASDEEVELIKKRLEKANSFQGLEGFHGVPWEKKPFAAGAAIELLPKEQWRYFVISFEETNIELENLGLASCLASIELEIGFKLLRTDPQLTKPPCHGVAPGSTFSMAESGHARDKSFHKVTRADVEEISSINSN